MNTEFLGKSYLKKLADLSPSSQIGQANQGLSALSGAQYNCLHQHPDLAVALHKAVSLPQSAGTQTAKLEAPYAKYINPASVRAQGCPIPSP
jgi:hypothetical protein